MLWLAHRVQRPYEKINHALVLGGKPGIGKDTILEPVKQAVGPWNFADVSPQHVLGHFNGLLKSVILRINEARDLGEFDRFAFYDHMKAFIAAPPDVLRVDEKHLREYYVFNLCGVVITTNHKTDGIYLPADDRRHFVAWSTLEQGRLRRSITGASSTAGTPTAATKRSPNISPAAICPTSTPRHRRRRRGAFWEIANANRAPEDAELADVLDDLGQPDVGDARSRWPAERRCCSQTFAEWLRDSKANARRIPHRFEDCGYVAVRNPNDSDGRWKIGGRRHTIYGKASLTESDRLDAAFKLVGAR